MAGQSALLIGATGGTGKHLLRELLASPHFMRVGEFGRRVTPKEQLPSGADKLQQKVIDFEKLDEAGLKEGNWDVVLITLGTSLKAAGSAANFEKIDREYVLNVAKAAKTEDPNHLQRLVYLSSSLSDAKSSHLYPRNKGLTEQGMASIGYSDTIVFRPFILRGAQRPEFRLNELLIGLVTTPLSYISSRIEIYVSQLAKSMRIAAQVGSADLPAAAEPTKENFEGKPLTFIGNKGALYLSKENM